MNKQLWKCEVKVLVGLLMLLPLLGCGREEAGQALSPHVASSGTATPAASGTGDGTVLSLKIIPDEPLAGDTLQGVIEGSGSVQHWTWYRNGEVLTQEKSMVLPPNSAVRGDLITLLVRINDQELEAEVEIGNTPPRVIDVLLSDNEIFRGRDIVALPEGVDPDGDPVDFRYEWLIDGNTASIHTDAVLPGDAFFKGNEITLRVTPFDGQNEGPVFVPEPFIIPNGPPQIVTRPVQEFSGFEYRYQVLAEDPDEDSLIFALEEGPAGMTVDADTGLLLWALAERPIGDYPVTISVTDEEGLWAKQTFTIQMSQAER